MRTKVSRGQGIRCPSYLVTCAACNQALDTLLWLGTVGAVGHIEWSAARGVIWGQLEIHFLVDM
eukprot:scaffold40445_cov12-Tisochrysis_lutea.AAC.1